MNNIWLTIIGMGVITFLIRFSLILLAGRFSLGERANRALRYAPVAILSTFIFTEMVQPGGQIDLSLGNFRLLTGILTIAIAWWTRNIWLTMISGGLLLWLLASL